jgi:uncharacterized membrane protein YtjA (UPF0391 family)
LEGEKMKTYIIMLLVLLLPAAAILDPADMGGACAAIARVLFLIVPVIFIAGSAAGLVSRSRV